MPAFSYSCGTILPCRSAAANTEAVYEGIPLDTRFALLGVTLSILGVTLSILGVTPSILGVTLRRYTVTVVPRIATCALHLRSWRTSAASAAADAGSPCTA